MLNGIVVHAVRGKRQEYQPLQSPLVKSVEPVAVAQAFKKLGFTELYIADLDAIIECSTNFQPLQDIAEETGLKLMVDAGVTSIDRARKLLDSDVSKLVIGTETLASKGFLTQAVEQFGSDRVIVSLDLKGNTVLTKAGFDGPSDALTLLREFKGVGVTQVIVLDLLRVGSEEGVNLGFLRRVIEDVGVSVYCGGGVRNLQDLLELQKLGVTGALVATALHSGKITVSELKRQKML